MDHRFTLCAGVHLPEATTHRVVEVTDFAQAKAFVEPWEQLAGQLSEPNAFYLPWMLRPALEHLSRGKTFRLLFFFRMDGNGQTLDGVLPLMCRPLCRHLPVFSLHSLQHRYCFSTLPLLRAGLENDVVNCFVHWLYQHRYRYPVISLRGVSNEGAWNQVLRKHLLQRNMRFSESPSRQRALLMPGDDAQAYLERVLSSKKLKKYGQLSERLAEHGALKVRVLSPDAPLQSWLDAFVALELSGWKGKENTAMGCRPACLQFFQKMAHEAHQRRQLVMLALYLDERPLAMICDLFAPPGRFSFKVAFDEEYARFSPGVLLELENIRLAHTQKAQGLEWLDSCTSPDNGMLNRLWQGRRVFSDFNISSGSYLADAYTLGTPLLKRLRHWLKNRSGSAVHSTGA